MRKHTARIAVGYGIARMISTAFLLLIITSCAYDGTPDKPEIQDYSRVSMGTIRDDLRYWRPSVLEEFDTFIIHSKPPGTAQETEQEQLAAAEYLAATGFNSTVTFRTPRKDGATVKYKLICRPDVLTAAQVTEGVEPMPIGIYYVWVERDGKATSPTDRRYRIIRPTVTLDVSED